MPRRDTIPTTNSVLSGLTSGAAADLLYFERQLWKAGVTRVAGVDEAGRGPLAGPVVAAAVVFAQGASIVGVNDSKKLTPEQRDQLFDQIRDGAVAYGVGVVSADVIDEINILQATMLAMKKAVSALEPGPEYLLVDGNYYTHAEFPCTTIVKGDSRSFSVAAASILAKVTRDRLMEEYHDQYPEYGFDRHKGYGTSGHLAAIREYGRSPIHRKSFHVSSLDTPEIVNGQDTVLHHG